MMEKLAIIGHFGGEHDFCDGQTVKTLTLYHALQRAGLTNIDVIDTYYIKNNPIKFAVDLCRGLFRNKKFIVLLSSKGRTVLFPVLYLLEKYTRKEVYHYAIGGRLAIEVKDKPSWKKYVSSFSGNWMESTLIVDDLAQLGVTNAVYLPNFKTISCIRESEIKRDYEKPFRFCTFSRVMKEKGIEDAIAAIESINQKYHDRLASLDIYGPIEEGYNNTLTELLERSESCRYIGVIPPNQSVETLKDYYALLFPTYWKYEGMPGTIIDALSAALPVIARKWPFCDEMLTDHETGFVYEFDKPEMLLEKIEYAIWHEDEMLKMKKNCILKANDYSEETVIQKIIELAGLYSEE